jgi:hypothetical protein
MVLEASQSRRIRRQSLLDNMQEKSKQGINCLNCPGTCCTFQMNSMQITPVEAIDLYVYLKENNRLDDNLLENLNENIKEFRLDYDLFNSRRQSFMRRTYTCPFYLGSEKGCSISRESKPYGCLGFNSYLKQTTKQEQKKCTSELEQLEIRETLFLPEEALNTELREKLSLSFNKAPIPLALKEIYLKLKDS